MGDSPEIKLEAKLAELLTEQSSSNTTIADKIGVSPAAITQYRKGQTRPSLEKLVLLADELGVSLDYLVLGNSRDAQEVDPGPFVRYMDESIQETHIRTSRHSALVTLVGRRLSEIIDDEVSKYIDEDQTRRVDSGIITDSETLELEGHSEETLLLLRSFHYNLLIDNPETPGVFFTTVANNLRKDRRYRYLLSASADTDWSSVIPRFRDLLIDQLGSESAVRGNCSFRVTPATIINGCGLYRLDMDELEEDLPSIHDFLQEYEYVDEDGMFGYSITPSADEKGIAIMDEAYRTNARARFEDLWDQAEPV